MAFELEKPTDAPTGASASPYTRFLQYKSGKVQQAFAADATPDKVNAGFSYYDKEQKQAFKVENFTACVVAVLSGVSGTVKDGEYYNRYFSNLVFDTRTDTFNVRMFGADKVQFHGLYRDFKEALPQGVSWTMFLACYVPEMKEVVCIELTTGLQNAITRAISEATGTPQNRVSLFGLNELSSKFWAFRFKDSFVKRDGKGNDWSGKGEMYFMPEIEVGTLTVQKHPEMVETLSGIADEVRAYVANAQNTIRKGGSEQPVAPSTPPTSDGWPTEPPPFIGTIPTDGEEQLPF